MTATLEEKHMAFIEKDTETWKTFVRNLSWSKQKSNRDVLCLKCWKILKYEECVKHRNMAPDHLKSILTSKEFASETKFIAVARAMGKINYEVGKDLYENPYKSNDKRGRPSTQLLLYREEQRKLEEEKNRVEEPAAPKTALIIPDHVGPKDHVDNADLVSELRSTIFTLESKVDFLGGQV